MEQDPDHDSQTDDQQGNDPDPTDPTDEDVEKLDEDAPGRSLFEDGDANEPAEPA